MSSVVLLVKRTKKNKRESQLRTGRVNTATLLLIELAGEEASVTTASWALSR